MAFRDTGRYCSGGGGDLQCMSVRVRVNVVVISVEESRDAINVDVAYRQQAANERCATASCDIITSADTARP